MIKILGIYVSKDNNLMWIAYDDTHAIVFDATRPDILELALQMDPDKRLMNIEDILKHEKTRTKRELLAVFTTHSHWDHIGGNSEMRTKCKNVYDSQNTVEKIYKIGKFTVDAISTPCHTDDSFCFLVNDSFLITGDTLFFLGCGKFNKGTPEMMEKNFIKLKEKVKDDVICCYGHDYSKKDHQFAKNYFQNLPDFGKRKLLTFKEEKTWNVFMNYEKFVKEGIIENLQHLRNLKNEF